jgi:hypothetical protein
MLLVGPWHSKDEILNLVLLSTAPLTTGTCKHLAHRPRLNVWTAWRPCGREIQYILSRSLFSMSPMYISAFGIFITMTGWDLGFLISVMQTIERHLTHAISLAWTGIKIENQLSSPSILETNLTMYLLPSLRVEACIRIWSSCIVPINEGIYKPIFSPHFSVDVNIGASFNGYFQSPPIHFNLN